MGELEAKVKAGKQISLTDLADAAKAEAKKPKAKQSRKDPAKKALHPCAAQSRTGGTGKKETGAGKIAGIGGVTDTEV